MLISYSSTCTCTLITINREYSGSAIKFTLSSLIQRWWGNKIYFVGDTICLCLIPKGLLKLCLFHSKDGINLHLPFSRL